IVAWRPGMRYPPPIWQGVFCVAVRYATRISGKEHCSQPVKARSSTCINDEEDVIPNHVIPSPPQVVGVCAWRTSPPTPLLGGEGSQTVSGFLVPLPFRGGGRGRGSSNDNPLNGLGVSGRSCRRSVPAGAASHTPPARQG